MLSQFKRRSRTPAWIGGISLSLLVAAGVVAIARSAPVSVASAADVRAGHEHGATPETLAGAGLGDSQAQPTGINRRTRASCSECGVVESIRQVELSGDTGRLDAIDVKLARHVSGGKIVPGVILPKRYEVTVRFRDGSTTVLDRAGPHALRLGDRVIVIGRSNSILSSN